MFNGNSIFDPDVNNTGTQCQGMSYLISAGGPYLQYTVFASKCTVTVTRTDTGVSPVEIYLVPTTSNGLVPTGTTQLRSQNYVKWKTLGSANAGNNVKTIKYYMTMQKIFGKSKHWVMDEDANSAIFNADPAHTYYWNLKIQDPQLTTNFNCEVWVKMEYYTMLFDRIPEFAV